MWLDRSIHSKLIQTEVQHRFPLNRPDADWVIANIIDCCYILSKMFQMIDFQSDVDVTKWIRPINISNVCDLSPQNECKLNRIYRTMVDFWLEQRFIVHKSTHYDLIVVFTFQLAKCPISVWIDRNKWSYPHYTYLKRVWMCKCAVPHWNQLPKHFRWIWKGYERWLELNWI